MERLTGELMLLSGFCEGLPSRATPALQSCAHQLLRAHVAQHVERAASGPSAIERGDWDGHLRMQDVLAREEGRPVHGTMRVRCWLGSAADHA